MVNRTLEKSVDETRDRLLGRPKSVVSPISKTPKISFEFFPASNEQSETKLWQTIGHLEPLKPEYVSVTYGAGGSSQDRTVDTVNRIAANTSLNVAGHLTCVGADRASTDKVVDAYIEAGVKHIVALRGDSPDGPANFVPHPQGYNNAAELVEGIRKRTENIKDFVISVAAYPQIHPHSPSLKADLDNLKRKIDAGADRAITQYFFDPETFIDFRDQAIAAGITVPIIPGILPISNFAKVVEFSQICGARIPAWMYELFTELDDAPEIRQMVSATVTAELCTRLIDQGVYEFHFYTLNRSELTRAICRILGIRSESSDYISYAAVGV